MSDDDETVWIAQNWQTHDIYHTDKTCTQLQKGKNPQPRDLSEVGVRREECYYCANDDPPQKDPDWSYYKAAMEAGTDAD